MITINIWIVKRFLFFFSSIILKKARELFIILFGMFLTLMVLSVFRD